MTVANILAGKGHNIVSAHLDDTLLEVSEILSRHKIGAVIVFDDQEQLAGIISERDVVREVSKKGERALQEKTSSCMTAKVITCTEDESIDKLMEIMMHGRFRHIPVLKNNELLGIVSIGDVVKAKIDQVEHDAEEMRRYIAS